MALYKIFWIDFQNKNSSKKKTIFDNKLKKKINLFIKKKFY